MTLFLIIVTISHPDQGKRKNTSKEVVNLI